MIIKFKHLCLKIKLFLYSHSPNFVFLSTIVVTFAYANSDDYHDKIWELRMQHDPELNRITSVVDNYKSYLSNEAGSATITFGRRINTNNTDQGIAKQIVEFSQAADVYCYEDENPAKIRKKRN